MVRGGGQFRVYGIGEIIGIKNDGGSNPDKRAGPQAIMITLAVNKRKIAAVVIPANDVRVEVAVAVATGQRAPRIGRPFQAIVKHAAGQAGIPLRIKAEMVGRSRAIIDPAIGHIHQEPGGVEFALGEALVGQPIQITRAGWCGAGKIARHNLILPFADFPQRAVGLDGDHVRTGGQLSDVRRREARNDIQIAQHVMLPRNGRKFKLID